MNKPLSNFWQRAIWGTVFVAIVVGMTMYGFITLFLLALLGSTLCMYEYLKLHQKTEGVDLFFAFLLNFMVLGMGKYNLLLDQFGSWSVLLAQLALLHLIYFAWQLYRFKQEAWSHVSSVLYGNLYISMPWLLLLIMQPEMEAAYDFRWPLTVFILVWSSDTFAYLTGRAFGKNPLFKQLSPKKTVEGFIGGMILTAAGGMLLSYIWELFSLVDGCMMGAMAAVFGTVGDLAESAMKRKAEVKDSGKVIPGHGGALDRFDAFLFAVVAIYAYLVFAQIL